VDREIKASLAERLSDSEWAEYLFMRDNPRGNAREQWVHSAGCRCWFNVERDTVSYRIVRVYVGADPDQPVQSPSVNPAPTDASEPDLEFSRPDSLSSIAGQDRSK